MRSLKKYRLAKEHFELTPLDAALKVYRILNKKITPIFYDRETERRFYISLEQARLEAAARFGRDIVRQ